jgi:hypothetical protein
MMTGEEQHQENSQERNQELQKLLNDYCATDLRDRSSVRRFILYVVDQMLPPGERVLAYADRTLAPTEAKDDPSPQPPAEILLLTERRLACLELNDFMDVTWTEIPAGYSPSGVACSMQVRSQKEGFDYSHRMALVLEVRIPLPQALASEAGQWWNWLVPEAGQDWEDPLRPFQMWRDGLAQAGRPDNQVSD